MTKKEFIASQGAMTNIGNKRMLFWMIFFFASLISGIPLSSYIESHEQNYRWMSVVFSVGLTAFLLANMALLVWFASRDQKRFGHRCPHCNKALNGCLAQVAIASGSCGSCGERVFE